MANEFKIKKGLIVEGASGGAVVDIQGSQGQLFSVTDDLSGSIFAVSDISGVPILDVNSSGVSYFDGNVGIGQVTPLNSLDIYRATGDASIRIQANTAADSTILKFRNVNADADITVDYTTGNRSRMVFNTDNDGGYVPVLSLEANRDTLMYGNVGIGTTLPGAKLDVSDGTIYSIKLSNSAAYNSGVNNGIVFNGIYNSSGNNTDMASIRGGKETVNNTDFGGKLTFHTRINGGVDIERMVISSVGAIKFNAYGAGTLVTDASGNITAATSGAGTGTVTGGGSAGRVAYWTNANNITSNAGFTFNNSDLEIPRYLKHDGETNTYIGFENNATPVIFAGGWQLFGNDNLKFAALYGDGGIKLKTTLTGISVTGEGLFTGDVGIGTAINGYQLSLGSSGSGSIFAFGKIFTTGNIQSSTGNITSLKVGATTAANSNVKLDIDGRVLIRDSDGVADLYLGNYAADKHFRFHTDNSTTYFDMNCGTIRWREGSSTRFYFYPSTANMTINGTLTQNSDSRVKENIVEIDNCISKVQAMRGVYYNRTDYNTEATKVGVIAQEVEAVLPELILESPDDGLKSVAYAELTAVLINAIKEQQEIIEDLKTRIEQLEN